MLVVAAVPGWLALVIYLGVSGRELPALVIIWLAWVVFLVVAIIRRLGDGRVKWMVAGFVLTMTWQLVDTLSSERHWPAAQLHQIAMIGRGIEVISIAYVAVIVLRWIRSSNSRRRSQGSSDT